MAGSGVQPWPTTALTELQHLSARETPPSHRQGDVSELSFCRAQLTLQKTTLLLKRLSWFLPINSVATPTMTHWENLFWQESWIITRIKCFIKIQIRKLRERGFCMGKTNFAAKANPQPFFRSVSWSLGVINPSSMFSYSYSSWHIWIPGS